MSTACLRFYLLGMLELNSFINALTSQRDPSTILISVFSYLVFGQIIDN